MKTKITRKNQAENVRAAFDYYAGRKNQQATAMLQSFGILDGDKIRPEGSKYASYYIDMLKKLQQELSLTYLFVAHDLSVVRYISDRVVVMYLGSIVESAEVEELYSHPTHPYTQALLSAIPIADPDKVRAATRIPIKGEIPSPINLAPGCHFADRCPHATARCRSERPEMREIAPGHQAACHLI